MAEKFALKRSLLTVSPECDKGSVPIYGRMSVIKDEEIDQERALDRQIDGSTEVIRTTGMGIGRTYIDPDHSGGKRDVWRPEFEQLMVDLPYWGGMACADFDRVTRNNGVLERLIEIYEDNPHLKFLCPGTLYDLSTIDGRNMARLKVTMANYEWEQMRKRQRSRHAQLRAKGVTVRGAYRPFGTNEDKTLCGPEARLIRQACDQMLHGGQITAIVREWQAQGVKTTSGKEWRPARLRDMLRSPRLAGYRTHGKDIAIDRDGKPIMSDVPAIVPVDVWQAVQAVLDERANAANNKGNRLRYELSGLVRCGKCGTLMWGNARSQLEVTNRAGERVRSFSFLCAGGTHAGCGMSINGTHLTDLVEEYLEKRWADLDMIETDIGEWSGQAELDRINGVIAVTLEMIREGTLKPQIGYAQVAELGKSVDRLVREQAKHTRERVRATEARTSPLDRWAVADADRRRAMAAEVLEAVMVDPPLTRSRRFDPNRVTLVPRTG